MHQRGSTSTIVFPQELIELVIDYLHNDRSDTFFNALVWSTVHGCTLANKTSLAFTMTKQQRVMHESSICVYTTFFGDATTSVCLFVKEIVLRKYDLPVQTQGELSILPSMLDNFSNLAKLKIEGMCCVLDKALGQHTVNRLRNVRISLDDAFELPDNVDTAIETFRSNFVLLEGLGVLKVAYVVPMCFLLLPDRPMTHQ